MKKKVLFVIWSFTAGGGAERVLSNLINNLDESKYDISVLEFINFNIKKEKVNNNIKILKPIIKYKKSNNIIINILMKINRRIIHFLTEHYPKAIRLLFIKENYDIEVSFNYGLPSYIVSGKKVGQKLCWVHSSIEDLDFNNISSNLKNKIKIKNKRQNRAFKKFDNVIAISNKTEESIIKLYPNLKEKVIKIYNGYSFKDILRKSEMYAIEEYNKTNKYIFVGIGRLVQQKNFSLLIEVAYELKKSNLEFLLYILGTGEQKEMLESKIKNYNLQEYVKLVGYIDNPYPYIKYADLFCMTSETEGFPTVLIESMVLGCPFVSTNVAGADELSMEGECGIIVDNDPINISKKIITLVNDSDKLSLMKKRARKKSLEYSISKQKEKVEFIMDKIGE